MAPIDSREIAAEMKSVVPIGGVKSPIERFTTIITPSWIGSMPMPVPTAMNVGASSRIAAGRSRNMPTTSITRFIARMISQGSFSTVVAYWVTAVGIASVIST
jgi:hypothetical protein